MLSRDDNLPSRRVTSGRVPSRSRAVKSWPSLVSREICRPADALYALDAVK
jgi:hypothetical protein